MHQKLLINNVTVRPWSKANWEALSQYLSGADYRVPESLSMKKLDKLVGTLYKHLNRAIDIACPAVTIK